MEDLLKHQNVSKYYDHDFIIALDYKKKENHCKDSLGPNRLKLG